MDISLSDCEKEQIHIPELIQPHGYVLVFNKNTHIITRYSENFEHLIEQAKDKLIGKRISDVIPSSVYKIIKTKLDFSMYKRHTFFNAVLEQYFEKPIDIIICDAIREIILELVPNSNIEEDIHWGKESGFVDKSPRKTSPKHSERNISFSLTKLT